MNFPAPTDLNFKKYCLETHGSIENLIAKAKNGEIVAQADLGMAYSGGLGDELPKDTDKAIGWLNAAVEKGCESPFILEKLGELLDRKGTELYHQKAYEMYHRAARLGSTTSQLNLAEMYRCGVEGVVNEDLKEAFKWYKKAAGEEVVDVSSDLGVLGRLCAGTMTKLGNVDTKHRALMCLYKYYLEGNCPEGRPQPTKAVYYLTRAAELGDTEAQLTLGQIYLAGSCEQIKDVAKARRWLRKASANGDVRAKRLLEQCRHSDELHHSPLGVNTEALVQSLDILKEKLSQRSAGNLHPFVISQPVAFSEEMLCQFDWSPTARIYLQAFKLVKEGFEILHKSNFTDERGISLIARGYLTESCILQAFPAEGFLLPLIFQLCEKNLQKNPSFFEGLVVLLATQTSKEKISVEGFRVNMQKVMCLENLIHFIEKAEPNSLPPDDPFKFEDNYSSWLHVLYYFLGTIYFTGNYYYLAAEAYENSLKFCPSYFESKRGLGCSLMLLYWAKLVTKYEKSTQSVPMESILDPPKASDRVIFQHASWTTEKLRGTAVKVLEEYLKEAPPCHKSYPHVYYYLAQSSLLGQNVAEFRKYYELGQDAEEKRLPFFDPVSLPFKDCMSPFYQLLPNRQEETRCGNRACIKEVKENDLKTCTGCGNQKYCSKDCQIADWENHKATCNTFRGHKTKSSN